MKRCTLSLATGLTHLAHSARGTGAVANPRTLSTKSGCRKTVRKGLLGPISCAVLTAAFAPGPALALADLDCVGLESCSESGCAPLETAYTATIDWTSFQAELHGEDGAMEFNSGYPRTDPEAASGSVSFVNEATNSLLQLIWGDDIIMVLTGPGRLQRMSCSQAGAA